MSHMVAYVDGGSRGRRGPAGVGVVIEHSTGHRVEISECIGSSDNNYAEYAALLIALHYAVAAECCRLQVFSDSEVVVRQISGAYTCQSAALRRIHEICKRLISSLDHFAITHIRRESNSQADRLAKAAIDRAHRRPHSTEDIGESGPTWFESAMSHMADLGSSTGAAVEA
jgi:ribonuclease HI